MYQKCEASSISSASIFYQIVQPIETYSKKFRPSVGEPWCFKHGFIHCALFFYRKYRISCLLNSRDSANRFSMMKCITIVLATSRTSANDKPPGGETAFFHQERVVWFFVFPWGEPGPRSRDDYDSRKIVLFSASSDSQCAWRDNMAILINASGGSVSSVATCSADLTHR